MATVIHEPESPNFGGALGSGIGGILKVKASQALKKKDEEEFREKLATIQTATDRESAFGKAAEIAGNADEFKSLSEAVENFFPVGKPPKTSLTDIHFTDLKTGEESVQKRLVTGDQLSSEESLTKAFGNKKFKVRAAKAKDKPIQWVSPSGEDLGFQVKKPDPKAIPLSLYSAKKAKSKGSTAKQFETEAYSRYQRKFNSFPSSDKDRAKAIFVNTALDDAESKLKATFGLTGKIESFDSARGARFALALRLVEDRLWTSQDSVDSIIADVVPKATRAIPEDSDLSATSLIGKPAPAGIPEGKTFTNPETGERLIKRDGKWDLP